MNVGLISLGCLKNQVDSEEILSYLARNDFTIVSDLSIADLVIINTCGFLKASYKEAYDFIDEVHESYPGIPLIVAGCLAERDEEKIRQDKPFVDLIIPIHDYPNFGRKLEQVLKDKKLSGQIEDTKRELSTPSYQAILKISDGCNNRCTYCTIPLIRGSFHSIPLKTLQLEMDEFASKGIKELLVISQDTTRYGTDHPELNENICTLLKEALKHEEFVFIRLLYLYPDEVTDELIELFKNNPRLVPYFDIPIQHSSDSVLRRMNRRGDRKYLLELFAKIRKEVKDATLRTTLIVGFPGETDEDIDDLISFIKEVKFDHLGTFTYSREEGTPGYRMNDQVPSKIKAQRFNKVMKEQVKISMELNRQRIGKVYQALITGFDENSLAYQATSPFLAPDDIDGELLVYSKKPHDVGDVVTIKIVEAFAYDLTGEEI